MPRGSHTPRIDYPPLRIIQVAGDAFAEGIKVIERDRIKLRVYSVARTVANCCKHRNKLGLDVALEALKDAHTRKKVRGRRPLALRQNLQGGHVMRPYREAVQ